MKIDAFHFILLIGALSGFTMVVGGILLLYKGAISLTTSGGNSLSVEFRRELRISTQYPALAFFLIGLMFMALSMWMGRDIRSKVIIDGTAVDVDQPVTVSVSSAQSWSSEVGSGGSFAQSIDPEMEAVVVAISAPGYEPQKVTAKLGNLMNGHIDIGSIQMKQQLKVDQVDQSQIAPLPQGVTFAPLNTQAVNGATP